MVRCGVLAVVVASSVGATEQPQLELRPGVVGAAYVKSERAGKTTLTLVFPRAAVQPVDHAVKGRPVVVKGELALFDDKGVVQRFSSKDFTMKFWCENDGGVQVRAELEVTLKLARRLVPKAELQQLAAFITVVEKGSEPKLDALPKGESLAVSGDLDGDGTPEVGVATAPDEAQNCDGKPANNLTMTLVSSGGKHPLRCCGP